MEKQTIEIDVEVNGIEEAQEKADELVKTLEKAKTLADELALKELLQVIASNQEQTSDTCLSYDPETGIGITVTPEGKKQTKVTGDLVAGI